MSEGHARSENPIEEAPEDGGKVEPPLRKYENEPFRRFEPSDELCHVGRIVRDIEVAGALGRGEARIEVFSIKVEYIDRMAALFQHVVRRPGNSCGETLSQRVGKHQQDMHAIPPRALRPGRQTGVAAQDTAGTDASRLAILGRNLAVAENQLDESDVRAILRYPHTMIGSDGLPHDIFPHPRLWGTFPRVLGHYSRDEGLFPLEEAVWRMTSLPAAWFGFADRGVLRPGNYADLVVFDPETVIDRSTFLRPTEPASGIELVVCNGKVTAEDGQATGIGAGRVLRRDPSLTPWP